MGGQLGYEGLWIDEDFIHGRSRAGPVCTTYQSPQLSYNEDFTIEEVEGDFITLKRFLFPSFYSHTNVVV